MPLTKTAYGPEIEAAALEHGLDPQLVEAIVIVESGGKTSAFRYEPGVWGWLQRNPRYAKANPLRVASSYGLLQILACTAHDMGLPMSDPPEVLFQPAIGLEYGCRYLAFLKRKFPTDLDHLLCAYNGGPGVKRLPDGSFINASYAAKVRKHLAA